MITLLRILVPLDGSTRSETVLAYLPKLAAESNASVTLFQAVDDRPYTHSTAPPASKQARIEAAVSRAEEYLKAVEHRLQAQGMQVAAQVVLGPPTQRAVEAAQRARFDLVALAGRVDLDTDEWGRHSVSETIMRATDVPVLVVRPDVPIPTPGSRFQHIIVPLDGSRVAESALSIACAVAERTAATLHLLQAVPTPDQTLSILISDLNPGVRDPARSRATQEEAQRYLRRTAGALPAGIACQIAVVETEAVNAITAYAADRPDSLVVLCTVGARGPGSSWRIGGVAERILEYHTAPVLLAPPRV